MVRAYLLLFFSMSTSTLSIMVLPLTEQFSKLIYSILFFFLQFVTYYCFSHAINTVPIAIAYATWCAFCITSITILGYFLHSQAITWVAALGLIFIVIGCVLASLPANSAL